MLRKVAGYKINIKTTAVFLYMNNEKLQREIKKISFTTATMNKIVRNKLSHRG